MISAMSPLGRSECRWALWFGDHSEGDWHLCTVMLRLETPSGERSRCRNRRAWVRPGRHLTVQPHGIMAADEILAPSVFESDRAILLSGPGLAE